MMPTVTIGDNTGDDFAGGEDCRISEAAPDVNENVRTSFAVEDAGVGAKLNSMLSFSGLSNIPAASTVSAATIYLYQIFYDATTEVTFKRALVQWIDSQVTWNDRITSTAWTGGGCTSDGNDRSATASFQSTLASGTNSYKSFTTAQIITDTQNFVDTTWSNYGYNLARTDGGTGGNTRFRSDTGTDGQRPYISVTYTAGAVSFDLTATDSYIFSDSSSISASAVSTQSDSFILSDSQSITVSALLGMSDGVSFGDQDQGIADLIAQLSDSYVFSDIASLTQSQDFDLTLSDGIIWSDSLGAIAAVSLTLSDGYDYSDALQLIANLSLSCVDGYIVSDTFFTGEPVEGPIKISVQTKQGIIDFVIKKTAISTTVKKPIISTETE